MSQIPKLYDPEFRIPIYDNGHTWSFNPKHSQQDPHMWIWILPGQERKNTIEGYTHDPSYFKERNTEPPLKYGQIPFFKLSSRDVTGREELNSYRELYTRFATEGLREVYTKYKEINPVLPHPNPLRPSFSDMEADVKIASTTLKPTNRAKPYFATSHGFSTQGERDDFKGWVWFLDYQEQAAFTEDEIVDIAKRKLMDWVWIPTPQDLNRFDFVVREKGTGETRKLFGLDLLRLFQECRPISWFTEYEILSENLHSFPKESIQLFYIKRGSELVFDYITPDLMLAQDFLDYLNANFCITGERYILGEISPVTTLDTHKALKEHLGNTSLGEIRTKLSEQEWIFLKNHFRNST